jgi:hypothetical protein
MGCPVTGSPVTECHTQNLNMGRQYPLAKKFSMLTGFHPGVLWKTMRLVSFSYVGDDGCLYQNTEPAAAAQNDYACGLFEFTKPI